MPKRPSSNRPALAARIAFAVIATTSMLTAWAGDEATFAPLALDAVIPCSDREAFDEDVVRDCDWNRTMPQYLVDESHGRISLAADGAASDRRLTLVAETMHAVGGAGSRGRSGWSSPAR